MKKIVALLLSLCLVLGAASAMVPSGPATAPGSAAVRALIEAASAGASQSPTAS